MSDDLIINESFIEEFFYVLKSLDYKSYSGKVKGMEDRKIEIVLHDETNYIFEAYYIILNGKAKQYKCNTICIIHF